MSIQDRMDELFLKFTDAQWERMKEDQKLDALQQMENLIAQEQGRQARKVEIFVPKEGLDPQSVNGYFDGHTIHLSPKFFARSRLIPGISSGKGMQALNTLLHEGRHAWQRDVVDSKVDGVDPRMRTLLRMNQVAYCPPGVNIALYACQPNERDARRFAKDRFAMLAVRAMKNGHKDPCIAKQYQENITVEQLWAQRAARELTVKQLLDYEKMAVEAMRKLDANVELDGVSMFDEVIAMMKGWQEFVRYVDGRPIGWENKAIVEADVVDKPVDAAEEDLDPALRGLLDMIRAKDGASGRTSEKPDFLRIKPY